MARILCIESSGDYSSAALFENEDALDQIITDEERSHSRLLASYIQSLIQANGGFSSLDAIAVSAGPGSYTGLRIGISIAKGLCFSLTIPLITISTLEIVAHGASKRPDKWVIPVLHARKNEVYTAIYDDSLNIQMEAQPMEITADSFAELGRKHDLLFCGDGANIVKAIISNQGAEFQDNLYPTAMMMGSIAFHKFDQNDFADVDNFEPEYLKPVYTTQPKSK